MTNSNCVLFFVFCTLFVLGCSIESQVTNTNTKVVYASLGSSPVDNEIERKYTLMEREIEYLMDIWEGDYDNVEQLTFESDRGMKNQEQGQHLRVHSSFTKFKNDRIGEYLLYVSEYKNNEPKSKFREYIYKFSPEDDTAEIRVEMYKFKEAAGDREEDALSKLKLSSLTTDESCDLIIHREGRGYVGQTAVGTCDSALGVATPLRYHVKISEDHYGFKYTQESASSKSESVNQNWYLLDKARCFLCMIDFPKEEGGRPIDTKHYIEIHDQGGQFEFDYLDGRHMVLTMRNNWSYYMKRNTFVIVLQEESLDGKVLIYTWGQDGADRIGMNPGYLRVQCDIKNEENKDLQKRLRADS